MAIHKKNAFAARTREQGRKDSYERDGQVTILGRPNAKIQRAFNKALKTNVGDTMYNSDFRGKDGQGGNLRTTNYGEDYWEGEFRDHLEQEGLKVRVNKYNKPTSIYNPKDGSNYRISYGGRDANDKPIRMSENGQGFNPKEKSRLGAMGLSNG